MTLWENFCFLSVIFSRWAWKTKQSVVDNDASSFRLSRCHDGNVAGIIGLWLSTRYYMLICLIPAIQDMVIYKIEHDNDHKVVQSDANVSCRSRSWLERARTWRKCIVVRTFGQVENQKDTLMVPLLRFRCNYPVFPPILGPSASPGRYQIISRTW